jgi:hypothetical protein
LRFEVSAFYADEDFIFLFRPCRVYPQGMNSSDFIGIIYCLCMAEWPEFYYTGNNGSYCGEGKMRKSKSTAVFWLCAVLIGSVFITGCSSESTNNRKAVTLKWNQETEETESAVESTEEDNSAFNWEILQKMKELNENGEYLDAVKAAQDMDKMSDYSPEIAALRNQIIRENREYFETQIDPAFENGDYYLIGALSNLFLFDKEKKSEYDFVKKLQGEYVLSAEPDGVICVIISGYEIQINGRKSKFSYKRIKPFEQIDYYENRLFLEDGTKVEEVNVGVIAVTYKNKMCIKYTIAGDKENTDKTEKESEAEKEKEYSENEPCIGMTKGEVLNSDWGMPTEINKTTYEWGVSEQWVYPDNKYIYIEEDVVVAITE